MDLEKIESAVYQILEAIGEDPNRSGLQDTPKRVARMYAEIFSGVEKDPAEHAKVVFHEDTDEIVLVKDIPFYSTCEHHLVPFFGVGPYRLHAEKRTSDRFEQTGPHPGRGQQEASDTGKNHDHGGGHIDGTFGSARGHGRIGSRAHVHDHARREEAGQQDGDVGGPRCLQAIVQIQKRSAGINQIIREV